jgi:hypothetical protein
MAVEFGINRRLGGASAHSLASRGKLKDLATARAIREPQSE